MFSPILHIIFPKDRWVWMPHKEFGYLPAKIIEQGQRTIVFETIYRKRHELPLSSQTLNLPQATTKGFFNDLDDLINLEDFSEGFLI